MIPNSVIPQVEDSLGEKLNPSFYLCLNALKHSLSHTHKDASKRLDIDKSPV